MLAPLDDTSTQKDQDNLTKGAVPIFASFSMLPEAARIPDSDLVFVSNTLASAGAGNALPSWCRATAAWGPTNRAPVRRFLATLSEHGIAQILEGGPPATRGKYSR